MRTLILIALLSFGANAATEKMLAHEWQCGEAIAIKYNPQPTANTGPVYGWVSLFGKLFAVKGEHRGTHLYFSYDMLSEAYALGLEPTPEDVSAPRFHIMLDVSGWMTYYDDNGVPIGAQSTDPVYKHKCVLEITGGAK